ncbi:MAG: 16S rRNA (cytosine(1402)-N(4))-methyltransferase RsmH [Patescibacteria group bacterium]
MSDLKHVPVLLDEVLEGLQLTPDMNVIDGTLGGGGHAAAILERTGPSGKLLGLDLDPVAIQIATQNLVSFKNRIEIKKDSYVHVSDHIAFFAGKPIMALLLDLGMSSLQLDDTSRGFSYMSDNALDMTFDGSSEFTAQDLLMKSSEQELADIFSTYGEERFAKRIARTIVKERVHEELTGKRIREICEGVYKAVYSKPSTTHPATRVWQAVRIAVNNEFEHIEKGILAGLEVLHAGGRIAIITFHSLEDALVKKVIRDVVKGPEPDPNSPLPETFIPIAKKVTTKPILPSEEEKIKNPRARSAQLRIIEKI